MSGVLIRPKFHVVLFCIVFFYNFYLLTFFCCAYLYPCKLLVDVVVGRLNYELR